LTHEEKKNPKRRGLKEVRCDSVIRETLM